MSTSDAALSLAFFFFVLKMSTIRSPINANAATPPTTPPTIAPT